jgi:hypothetical protein
MREASPSILGQHDAERDDPTRQRIRVRGGTRLVQRALRFLVLALRHSDAIYKYPTEGSSNGANLNLDLPTYAFPAYALAFDHSGNLVVPYERLDHNPPKYLAIFRPGATEPKKRSPWAASWTWLADWPSNSGKLFYVATANDHEWLQLTYPKRFRGRRQRWFACRVSALAVNGESGLRAPAREQQSAPGAMMSASAPVTTKTSA